MLYAFNLGDLDGQQTLGSLVTQMIGGKPVVGDHVEWNGMVWTIVEIDGNSVRKIGVKPATKKPHLPPSHH